MSSTSLPSIHRITQHINNINKIINNINNKVNIIDKTYNNYKEMVQIKVKPYKIIFDSIRFTFY